MTQSDGGFEVPIPTEHRRNDGKLRGKLWTTIENYAQLMKLWKKNMEN
jgi:hypothetical protein